MGSESDRPGLYLCCIRAAERYDNAHTVTTAAIKCAKCGQVIVCNNGVWRAAAAIRKEKGKA